MTLGSPREWQVELWWEGLLNKRVFSKEVLFPLLCFILSAFSSSFGLESPFLP